VQKVDDSGQQKQREDDNFCIFEDARKYKKDYLLRRVLRFALPPFEDPEVRLEVRVEELVVVAAFDVSPSRMVPL